AKDAFRRLIEPSIEREVRSDLTKTAQEKAIVVFKKNLEQLLLQPPVAGRTVMGWDPAFRTGCKIAVVDETGKVLDTTVIYPTPPHNRTDEARKIIGNMVRKYGVSLIALGNGTASRESEQVIVSIIKDLGAEKITLRYVIVNEAGASVYSASELADKEFPEFDVGLRSAASMARRLQDPLAELVKIDPAALGVGQYQHDMNEKRLSEALGGVVEDCVNRVGADLNTASFALLSYVSGITPAVAARIVEEREKNGPFRNRRQLLKVSGLGPRTFEQCAGFLRIRDGEEVLDATAVHPEDYKAVHKMLEELSLGDTETDIRKASGMVRKQDIPAMAKRLGIGEITLSDILSELEKPGRDIREELEAPLLKSDVLTMEDLVPGMRLKGTVRNIVDFGAFVDIGVHQDGLVHISQLADRFVRDPMQVVKVGDIVEVTVLSCDPAKKRISLSMKTPVAHQP
ncbi:MAG: helix-hairpin-helix domain-containing protein, partial [Lachnospiraceae bacterium]|nr:helix-hairpin-helix domain-containing protein [Lachnospiraceae bacterium]